MYCKVCGKPINGIKHYFSGYGWEVGFCPEHCPGEIDSTKCIDKHPNGWKPKKILLNREDIAKGA